MKKLTKKEWMKRMETAYDLGLLDSDIVRHLYKAYDAVHRLEGNQFQYFAEFIISENERTKNFSNHMQLANDELGYNVIKLLAIFIHPCQICAEDKGAWHTRSGFCPHKR